MLENKIFELKEEHVKLMRQFHIGWVSDEFGAPEVDPKRPYGNSDVIEDIAEILGYDTSNITKEQEVCFNKLHEETKTALQVVLSVGSFETGTYESDWFGKEWKKKNHS